MQYYYSDRAEQSLNLKGLTFSDLEYFQKAGTYEYDGLDPTFKHKFGYNTKLTRIQYHCLCGHSIKQQCYICPEGSNNVGDIIIVGNRCINR